MLPDFGASEFFADHVWAVRFSGADGKLLTIHGRHPNGQPTTVVFTDQDLVERFIANMGMGRAAASEIPTAKQYLDYLQTEESAGVRWVEYDPPDDGRQPFLFPITRVIHDVRAQCDTGE